mmetsp:Transcript_2491/g.5717  ORF Transcript_2491/g.5717 Transcript_2491/m.5717 type:complete len:243 (+) Transcript_2491:1128-1856(+)
MVCMEWKWTLMSCCNPRTVAHAPPTQASTAHATPGPLRLPASTVRRPCAATKELRTSRPWAWDLPHPIPPSMATETLCCCSPPFARRVSILLRLQSSQHRAAFQCPKRTQVPLKTVPDGLPTWLPLMPLCPVPSLTMAACSSHASDLDPRGKAPPPRSHHRGGRVELQYQLHLAVARLTLWMEALLRQQSYPRTMMRCIPLWFQSPPRLLLLPRGLRLYPLTPPSRQSSSRSQEREDKHCAA